MQLLLNKLILIIWDFFQSMFEWMHELSKVEETFHSQVHYDFFTIWCISKTTVAQTTWFSFFDCNNNAKKMKYLKLKKTFKFELKSEIYQKSFNVINSGELLWNLYLK